ncbi:phage integrase N-terminal SAM-like domain-containing protein [Mesorhizobium sp. M0244]|uniref:tyrosine-type recombinase/integrase n=1 Tax=Mesorhizobium sp. M0244 TaxID=2956926 RepID=UPI00333AE438
MEFPSTRGTCHGYSVYRRSDHATSPAHAARYADAGLGPHTQQDYVRHVRRLAAFLGRAPDTATTEDIRRFQLHQHENGMGPATINGAVSALRFLFTVTLKRRDLARALVVTRYPRKLPEVLSVEEAARLLEAAPGIKYKAALGVAARLNRCERTWRSPISSVLPAPDTGSPTQGI